MKDASQEAANILGDAVQQMQAARDKPRDDPEAVMEAALRRIIADAELLRESANDATTYYSAKTLYGIFSIAREAIRTVEAWRASE